MNRFSPTTVQTGQKVQIEIRLVRLDVPSSLVDGQEPHFQRLNGSVSVHLEIFAQGNGDISARVREIQVNRGVAARPAHPEPVLIRQIGMCANQHATSPEQSETGQPIKHSGMLRNDAVAPQHRHGFTHVAQVLADTLRHRIFMSRNEFVRRLIIGANVKLLRRSVRQLVLVIPIATMLAALWPVAFIPFE